MYVAPSSAREPCGAGTRAKLGLGVPRTGLHNTGIGTRDDGGGSVAYSADERWELELRGGICPLSHIEVVGLWRGPVPVVPATVWLRILREDLARTESTCRRHGHALLRLFRFLDSKQIDFWDLSVAHLRAYKRTLLHGDDRLSPETARTYMRAVERFLRYWLGPSDHARLFGGPRGQRRSRGILRHLTHGHDRVSDVFEVNVPRKHRRQRRRGLPHNLRTRVWEYLERPLSAPTAQGGNAAEAASVLALRNKAIWAFLLATGLRIGELVRIRLEDLDYLTGEVHLQERPEDAWLGELKTGPATIYLGPSNPLMQVVQTWEMFGRDRALELRGSRHLHQMLFCNVDGGPLTKGAVRSLFNRIDRDCELSSHGYRLTPHRTRHTIATVLLNAGVRRDIVQAFLRHQSSSTTDVYAAMEEARVREALRAFWAEAA